MTPEPRWIQGKQYKFAQDDGGGLAMMSNYGGDEQQENSDDGSGEGDSGPFRVSCVVRMLVFKLVVVVIQV